MDIYITLHIITQSDSHFDVRYENRCFDNPCILCIKVFGFVNTIYIIYIYIYQNSLLYGLLQENLLITWTPLMRHTCVIVTANYRGYPISP